MQGANSSATDGASENEAAGTGMVAAFNEVDDLSCDNFHYVALWIVGRRKGFLKGYL